MRLLGACCLRVLPGVLLVLPGTLLVLPGTLLVLPGTLLVLSGTIPVPTAAAAVLRGSGPRGGLPIACHEPVDDVRGTAVVRVVGRTVTTGGEVLVGAGVLVAVGFLVGVAVLVLVINVVRVVRVGVVARVAAGTLVRGVTTGRVVRRAVGVAVAPCPARSRRGRASGSWRGRAASEVAGVVPVSRGPFWPICDTPSRLRVSPAASSVSVPVAASAPAVRPPVRTDTRRRVLSRSRLGEVIMTVMFQVPR